MRAYAGRDVDMTGVSVPYRAQEPVQPKDHMSYEAWSAGCAMACGNSEFSVGPATPLRALKVSVYTCLCVAHARHAYVIAV